MLYSCSVPKRVESASTMVSVIWWVIGFYWVTAAGGQDLKENSPQLYWFVRTNFALMCPLYIYFIFFWYVYWFSCWFLLQALCYISCFRRALCNHMRCCCMSHWYCCLLLPSMYNWHLVCYDRPGKIFRWHTGQATSDFERIYKLQQKYGSLSIS